MLEPGLLRSVSIAFGIVSDMEDGLGRQSQFLCRGPENFGIRFGGPDLAGEKVLFEEVQHSEVFEDGAESPVKIGEQGAPVAPAYLRDDVLRVRHGKPGARRFEVPIQFLEKDPVSLIRRKIGSGLREDFAHNAAPPAFLMGVGNRGIGGKGRGCSLPDRAESAIEGIGIRMDSVLFCHPCIGNTDRFGELDQGVCGIKGDGLNGVSIHSLISVLPYDGQGPMFAVPAILGCGADAP